MANFFVIRCKDSFRLYLGFISYTYAKQSCEQKIWIPLCYSTQKTAVHTIKNNNGFWWVCFMQSRGERHNILMSATWPSRVKIRCALSVSTTFLESMQKSMLWWCLMDTTWICWEPRIRINVFIFHLEGLVTYPQGNNGFKIHKMRTWN